MVRSTAILQARCRLLELPGELRDHIYEHALRQDDGFLVIDLSTKWSRRTKHTKYSKALALTLTCKQINRECGDRAYRLNTVKVLMPISAVPPGRRLSMIKALQNVAAHASKLAKVRIQYGVYAGGGPTWWYHISSKWSVISAWRLRERTEPSAIALQFMLDCECRASVFDFYLENAAQMEGELEEVLRRGFMAWFPEVEWSWRVVANHILTRAMVTM